MVVVIELLLLLLLLLMCFVPSLRDFQQLVLGMVAPHMKLRGGVEFVTEVPRSRSGKILRRSLREKAKQTAQERRTDG